MVLVCNVCVPEKDGWKSYDDKGVMAIAKWYPAGGFLGGDDGAYYRNNTETMGKDFEDFLIRHAHKELASEHYSAGAGQENPVRIEYENDGLPILEKHYH